MIFSDYLDVQCTQVCPLNVDWLHHRQIHVARNQSAFSLHQLLIQLLLQIRTQVLCSELLFLFLRSLNQVSDVIAVIVVYIVIGVVVTACTGFNMIPTSLGHFERIGRLIE